MADLHYRASLCKSALKNRLCLSLSVGSTYQWKLAPKIAVLYPFMKSLIKIDKISARALMDSIVYMSPAKLRSTLRDLSSWTWREGLHWITFEKTAFESTVPIMKSLFNVYQKGLA